MKVNVKWKNKNSNPSVVARWIVETILKLDTKHLQDLFILIHDELEKRGAV